MKKILKQCKGKKIKVSIPILLKGNDRSVIDNFYYVTVTKNALSWVLNNMYDSGFDLTTVKVDTETNHGIVYIDLYNVSKLKP